MTSDTSGPQLPERARVVVVGGGIIGTSIAYHLAHMGCQDVVLLERDKLTSGTTWHAAGLMVTFGSMSETSTELRKYTRDLYSRLEAETGLATGLKQVGFVQVATDADRLEEYRRVSAFNRLCGVDVHEVSPARSRACSRWRTWTTCWPGSTSPRTAGPTRSTSPCRWPRAPACRAYASSRTCPPPAS
ncbi:NAD(P)/FAD-dependent oxidoreductase [Catellatospora coxensis]